METQEESCSKFLQKQHLSYHSANTVRTPTWYNKSGHLIYHVSATSSRSLVFYKKRTG